MHRTPRPPAVIYEDNHIIVIDKPPLLATMGARADEPSLVQWARNWLKRKYDKPGNVYLGVVSRLDAFTSGLILLAKTSKAAGRLTKQFQSGQVRKTYLAILEQRPRESQGRLVDWIRKDDQRRRMVVVQPQAANAKRAELEYQVSGYSGDRTLVQINLVTGRKHQIRLQFSSRGCPVLGDRKYAGKQPFGPGIALQSSSLQFVHPVRREPLSFRIEPPEGWELRRFANK